MRTRSATLLLVANDPRVGALVTEAARLAFSPVVCVTMAGVAEALERSPAADEILVLLDPAAEELPRAREAKDAQGLPRWPMVILGDNAVADDPLASIPRAIWSAPWLARIFREAVERHELLRDKQRAIGDLRTMAHRVSHDLRTPLGGVLSTAEVLKDVLAEKDAKAAELTQPLFNSVDGIVKLLERVGVVLKASAAPQRPERMTMDEPVYNATVRLEPMLQAKGIKVRKPAAWPEIEGVASWTEVVWWNLIRNALQHGGASLTTIELGWEPQQEVVRFVVRDNGQGVPEKKRARLIQPFHALSDPGALHGLGLAIVQRLVTLQGGVCGYEPSESGGSVFFFTLPTPVSKPAETPPAVIAEKKPPVAQSVPVVAAPLASAPSLPLEEIARMAALKSAERFSPALEAADLGGWIWDAATDVITLTRRAAEIYGVPPDQTITRQQLREVLFDGDAELARVTNEKAMATRTDYDLEYRLLRPSGELSWIATKGRATYGPGGELTGMLGVAQDITARKRTEAALRKQNERLQLLSDALAHLLGAKDPKQIVHELLPKVAAHLDTDGFFNFLVNAQGDALELNAYGGVPEEIVGRLQRVEFGQAIVGTVALTRTPIHAMDIQHSDYDKAKLVRGFGIQAYACHPFVVEGQFLGTLSFATRKRPRFDDDEIDFMRTISHYVALALDRARSEQESTQKSHSLAELYSTAQASESQLRLVTDHAPVNLAHLNRELRFKFVNRIYSARFDLRPEEVVGRHVSELLGTEAYEAARPHMEAALAGQQVSYEMEMPIAGLGQRWMSVVYVPERAANGEVVGFVAMTSDITSRKHAEQEAELSRDKALAASRAKDDFLAALSHELRTPLNPVLLLASAAAENPRLSLQARADFATIRKNVELEARLIDDLLDLTRITRGKLSLELRFVDIRSVLRDAVAAVRAEVEKKQIVLNLDLGSKERLVMGDAVRLQQVFWNVLNNAVKFTPPGGKISVVTHAHPEDRTLVIQITDSGVGMTEEELGRVFNAFSQGEHANRGGSHRFGGLGLGLAISKMLVEQHSGSVRAESAGRDQGSTFAIELPLARASHLKRRLPPGATDLNPPAPQPAPLVATRILLVEDHEPTRKALAHLLELRRFKVSTAGSVAEAKDLARQGNYQLLISDIGLPDGNGCDLMADLRGQQDLRGIALTGYGMEADIERSRAAGFMAHLIKPVSVQAMEKAIATVCGAPTPADRSDGKGHGHAAV